MKQYAKVLTCFFLIVLFATIAIAQVFFELSIPSTGTIAYDPEGKLQIGQESLGQNPCFFYDQNGHLVTLRMGQAWAENWIWYQTSTLDPELTWAQADIELMKNTSRNAMRIHLEPVYFFDASGSPMEGNWTLLLNTLQDFKDNDLYFTLDWFPFAAITPTNYWLRNQWRTYSLFWNTTIQDNYIDIMNYAINRLKSAGVYSHLLYLNPNQEIFWTSWSGVDAATAEGMSPFRHSSIAMGGTGQGATTVAEESWHNWLASKYNNDITLLASAWDDDNSDRYDATTEFDFDNIKLCRVWDSNRQRDFQQWIDESAINYTARVAASLKAMHPNLYIAWDSARFETTYSTADNSFGVSAYVASVNSDIVSFHWYARDTTSYQHYLYGDEWQTERWQTFAALARTLKKPAIIEETGFEGANEGDYAQIRDSWQITISLAISNGFAGILPWYIQSYQGHRPSWYDMCWETQYQSVWKDLMDEYRYSESWIANIKYDKITIVVPHFDFSVQLVTTCLRQSGFNPEYIALETSDGNLYPDIPDDTSVIVLSGGDYYSSSLSDNLAQSINAKLNAGAKLLLSGAQIWDYYLNTRYLENGFNTAKFPLSPMVYGVSYTRSSNNTNTYLNLYGKDILLRRDAAYNTGTYTTWASSSVTGTTLVSTTDGTPWVIANNDVAWISALYMWQLYSNNAYSEYNQIVPYTYLVFKQIFDYWNIQPSVIATNTPIGVEYTFAYRNSTSGVIFLNNLNAISQNTVTARLNTAFDTSQSYTLLIRSNSSQVVISGEQLDSNEFTFTLAPRWLETIVIQAITE